MKKLISILTAVVLLLTVPQQIILPVTLVCRDSCR